MDFCMNFIFFSGSFLCFVTKLCFVICFTPEKVQRENFHLRSSMASLRHRDGISLGDLSVSNWCILLGFLSKRGSFC